MSYFDVRANTKFGMYRRNAIKHWFNTDTDAYIPINRKWQIQLKSDPDLRKLVKIGFLKQKRQLWNHSKYPLGWKKTGSNQTILVKA